MKVILPVVSRESTQAFKLLMLASSIPPLYLSEPEVCASAESSKILANIPAEESSKILANIPAEESSKILANIPTEESSQVLANIPTEESSKILANIPAEESSKILANIPAEESSQVSANTITDESSKILTNTVTEEESSKVLANAITRDPEFEALKAKWRSACKALAAAKDSGAEIEPHILKAKGIMTEYITYVKGVLLTANDSDEKCVESVNEVVGSFVAK